MSVSVRDFQLSFVNQNLDLDAPYVILNTFAGRIHSLFRTRVVKRKEMELYSPNFRQELITYSSPFSLGKQDGAEQWCPNLASSTAVTTVALTDWVGRRERNRFCGSTPRTVRIRFQSTLQRLQLDQKVGLPIHHAFRRDYVSNILFLSTESQHTPLKHAATWYAC